MTGGPSDEERVGTLRDVLTATGAGVYLATHVAGPIPAESMAAVHESDELELRIGRAGPDRADDLEQREKEARAVAAAVVKASTDRVILTHGAAEAARIIALELAATSRGPDQPGSAQPSRVLLHEGLEAPVTAAIRTVATVRGWDVDTTTALPQILSADIGLVAFPHVDRDGHLSDVSRVASAARAAGAATLLDASLSVGALPLDVSKAGLDAVVADTHHWLLGPEGVALAWLSPKLGPDLPARLRHGISPFGRGSLLALARSVGWLLMYIELPWVIERTQQLSDELYAALAAIEGVEIAADIGPHGAVAALRIDGWDAEQVMEELSRGVFAIVEADVSSDLVRVSVGAWNREDEIERFIGRVRELAVHTPETLPRKPSLTVLSGPGDRRS